MKKFLSFALALLMLAGVCAIPAYAIVEYDVYSVGTIDPVDSDELILVIQFDPKFVSFSDDISIWVNLVEKKSESGEDDWIQYYYRAKDVLCTFEETPDKNNMMTVTTKPVIYILNSGIDTNTYRVTEVTVGKNNVFDADGNGNKTETTISRDIRKFRIQDSPLLKNDGDYVNFAYPVPVDFYKDTVLVKENGVTFSCYVYKGESTIYVTKFGIKLAEITITVDDPYYKRDPWGTAGGLVTTSIFAFPFSWLLGAISPMLGIAAFVSPFYAVSSTVYAVIESVRSLF